MATNYNQVYQNTKNNAQGRLFEQTIESACIKYSLDGVAEISKTPEPFRVTAKHKDGRFTGRFIALAEPDFKGTLSGGQAICFEAKHTTTDRIKRSVLTNEQMDKLDKHEALGAKAGVCVGIQDSSYFIPWQIWKNMKAIFGRQYLKAEDVEQYRVLFNGSVMFLNYIHAEVNKK